MSVCPSPTPLRMSARILLVRGLLAGVLLAGASALAQAPEPEEAPPQKPKKTPEPNDATESGGDITSVLPLRLGSVEVGGRLSLRETLVKPQVGDWAGDLGLGTARLEFTYRWKKRVRAVVEFDAQDIQTGSSSLKDAFVWLRASKAFSFRAGHFKVPLSLIELESGARLPLVRRGLLRDVLDDALGLSGRRYGAQAEWKCEGCTQDLRVRVGAWQARDLEDEVAVSKGLGLTPALRGTWASGNLEVGVSALYQPSGASEFGDRNGWTTGLDVHHELSLGRSALRTWSEVLVGKASALTTTEGAFLTGRILAAWRMGGVLRGDAYVEPFVMASALEPDLELDNDLLWEGVGGLNAGQWRLWRLQAQFEVRKKSDGTPSELSALKKNLASRRALLVQLEVSF
ncbi:porin [Stigmatella sp. ncwal1]|uniref:Porin n=1 Tax=Stigmatella ashevillensis TaxID=2995309 RepID=A0ABT5DHA9_9BACT|nr:porin [Stigmatella ashevillena]MDC0712498.1 porin [Stigmatella ashevillena]